MAIRADDIITRVELPGLAPVDLTGTRGDDIRANVLTRNKGNARWQRGELLKGGKRTLQEQEDWQYDRSRQFAIMDPETGEVMAWNVDILVHNTDFVEIPMTDPRAASIAADHGIETKSRPAKGQAGDAS